MNSENKNNTHFNDITAEIKRNFIDKTIVLQTTLTEIPVVWIKKNSLLSIVRFLKTVKKPYNMLYDLHGVDERLRLNKNYPMSDFTVFYHFISIERNKDIILKVPLKNKNLTIDTISKIYKNADWYERETWDMFGITFKGHHNLTRIIMPKNWIGHPLRKDYYAKAVESDLKNILKKNTEEIYEQATESLMKNNSDNYTYINFGPNHPSTHGILRVILKLHGEEIVECTPDIGYHHRGAEKISEQQSWHGYIPYTNRIEYLGGCVNEMPYILAVEKLAGITVPEKTKFIRIMMSELFRINSHLLCISTFFQDIGAMSPVFNAFVDRQKIHNLIEEITGSRMHPSWFRIGGIAKDLPINWDKNLKELLIWLPKRIKNYKITMLDNSILISRSKNVSSYKAKDALEWGVTGAGLRATGVSFDVRKWRPYSGYENFEFEIPTGNGISDAYSRILIKIEEIYQSINILHQCLSNMPSGPFKAEHPLTTPPDKKYTLTDIETLITHFCQMSWGTVIPANETFKMIEGTKGINSYYIISDGGNMSYRTRIRTPSFAHIQQIPSVICGSQISDLITYLGSIDFVMSDVDR